MKKWGIIKSLNLSGTMNILIVQILCLCVILHSYENPSITCRRCGRERSPKEKDINSVDGWTKDTM